MSAAIDQLAERIQEARKRGALFHPTNPADNWFCPDCSVFGKGGNSCWSCGTPAIEYQYVPRFGGGAQSVLQNGLEVP